MSRKDRACVLDVQRIRDGPDVRVVVLLKGCLLDCAWCHSPEAVRLPRELSYWSGQCVDDCRACLEHCPEDALRDDREQRVDWSRCTHCGRCVEPCPTGALRMIGREVEAQELLEEILRAGEAGFERCDALTISGGEPVLQSGFLQVLLPLVREKGIPVTLETAGAVPWRLLEPLLGLVDVVRYDFKVASPLRHRAYTRRDNKEILDNLRRVLERSNEGAPRVEVRMPVVPGINSGDTEIAQAASLLRSLGINRLVLLQYVGGWEHKLNTIDTRRQPLTVESPPPEFYDVLRERFRSFGIDARVA